MVELWIFLLFAHVYYHPSVHTLKIIDLYVPRGASHEAPMYCRYDLEGEKLYDVKWYKDDRQFFKCGPDGTVQEFPLEGITLEYPSYASIGSCPVTLTRLTSQSAGKYRCEVSVDGPPFFSASETKDFRVIRFSPRIQEENEVTSRSSLGNRTVNNGGKRSQRSFTIVVMFLFIFLINKCYV